MKKIFLFIFLGISLLTAGVGDNAPDFTLDKLGGGTVSRNDFDGKVLYIFWFGFGCPYCDDNMRLAELNVTSNYNSDNFAAIGIDTWSGSNTTNVATFQASTANNSLPTGVTFPLLIDGKDVAQEYGVTYDRSMVIDQQGVIRYYGGSHSPHNWNEINDVIEEVLTTTDVSDEVASPYNFELKANYPNPFNPETHIPFTLNKTQNIKLDVYDISGRLVKNLLNTTLAAGLHTVSWQALENNNHAVSSGVYFIKLSGESATQTRQVILLK